MSALYEAIKQPNEILPITLDLTDYIPTGETVQGTSSVVITDSAGQSQTTSMLQTTTISSPYITAVVKAGTGGSSYTVTFTIKTTNYTLEEEVKLVVKERTAFT